MSLARFWLSWPSPHAWTVSLYTSWATWHCFHLLYASFFMPELCQQLCVYLCRLPATFGLFPAHFNGPFSSSGGHPWKITKISVTFLLSRTISHDIPEQAKVCSPEAQCCDPTICLVSFQNLIFRIMFLERRKKKSSTWISLWYLFGPQTTKDFLGFFPP